MRRADIEVPNTSVDVDSWEVLACYPRSTFYPLSDGNSTLNRRITNTCFRTCSTCQSRSQAPLCVCTLRTISNRAEGTFVRLRYILGGDRPSQTTHLTLFPPRIHGSGLEAQNTKGGIPRLAPRGLASPLHSLPPILDNVHRTPTSSCSKGSRGLSVQPRVLGIFTETTISPDPSLRQRPSRYAIRAGRNLPDKEFRYLRTVIVTAAVYRGLVSRLRPKANLST
jgi:hypothetical protein